MSLKISAIAALLNILQLAVAGAPTDSIPTTAPAQQVVAIEEAATLTARSAIELAHSEAMQVTLTGYSSTVDQTDDTPFTTASGKHVRDGIVASNFLPFGTKIMIPEHFGTKIFVVEDRMHKRFSDRIDIWFASREEAKKFGKEVSALVLVL